MTSVRTTDSDLRSSESRRSVQSNAISTRRSINLDLSSIGSESLSGVLGSDSTLDCVSSLGDRILRQSEFGKSSSSGDLDLSGDDVDSSDLLGDGVLDLNSG